MFDPKLDNNYFAPTATATERREAAEREQQRRTAERQKSIAALSSPHYDPPRRIQLWEHLHGMYLPRATDHRLVHVIAEQTALTVSQVNQEQLRRATAT